MEFIQRPNRKKFLLVIDDYVFVQTTSDTRYWHCINKRKCMSRLRFDKLGNITVHQKTHNHKPNRNQYVTAQLPDPPAHMNPINKRPREEKRKGKVPELVVKGICFVFFKFVLDRLWKIKCNTTIFFVSFGNLRVTAVVGFLSVAFGADRMYSIDLDVYRVAYYSLFWLYV